MYYKLKCHEVSVHAGVSGNIYASWAVKNDKSVKQRIAENIAGKITIGVKE